MRQEFFEQNLDHSRMKNTPIFKEKDVNNQLRGNGQRTKKYKKGSDFTMFRNPKDDFDLQFNFKQLVCRHSPTGLEFGYGGRPTKHPFCVRALSLPGSFDYWWCFALCCFDVIKLIL